MNNKNSFQVYNASAGSGKTFTLVKEYLKIILNTTDFYKFQHVLAITFTNKAAAEMKVRVIENLKIFAKHDTLEQADNMFLLISDELNLDKDILQTRARKTLNNILNNYAGFSITTIDSFTYKLVKSFAFDLGLSLNFEVEMDAISLLNEAVDVLIANIGKDKEITKILIEFSLQKSEDDKSWDIAHDLKEIAKLLLNENDIKQVLKLKNKSIKDFIDLKNNIYKEQKIIENKFITIGKKALKIIAETSLEFNDFASGDLPNHFKKLVTLNLKTINFEGRLAKNIDKDHHQYSGKADVRAKQEIDSIKQELITLYWQSKTVYQNNYQTYLLNKLIAHSLVPLAVLQAINSTLNELKETNNIRLNSEFNQLISTHLKEQPAAFIYEKIGEKYHHYFIDEMQDTSILQWQNLIPLIDNALNSQNSKGEKGSLLLVGDAKQSIYRWRGGKAEQFIDLTLDSLKNKPFLVKKHIHNLPINYRSYSEIINFNNSFFQFLAKHLNSKAYSDLYKIGNQQETTSKKGGFVQLNFLDTKVDKVEKELLYPKKIVEIITNLEGKFTKNEICILTRTKKQGIAIATYLTANNIDIISSETLLLNNSLKVQFIINLLQTLLNNNDKDAKFKVLNYLHSHLGLNQNKHDFITKFIDLNNNQFFIDLKKINIYFDEFSFANSPFYESIEQIIRAFKLTKISDAYLQFFLDVILDYTYKKNNGLADFLNYWDEKKEKLSIVVPEGKDAVRIMTIHKSKGLEFPVIIYPYDFDIYKEIKPKIWYEPLEKEKYNNFETALINFSSSVNQLGLTGEKLYTQRRNELELDNFNLIYVAFTRAIEQLYIISEHTMYKDQPKLISNFLIDFLKTKGIWSDQQLVFNIGQSDRISKHQKSKTNHFIQNEFVSSDWKNHNITIVANTVLDNNFEDARKYGNLIHEILAKVNTILDIPKSINHFVNKGSIPFEKQQEITTLINNIVNHKLLKKYYSNNYTILNERELLNNDKIIAIPDRILIKDNVATIIDYKTGKESKEHIIQVNNYAIILEKLNLKVADKLLVYIGNKINVLKVN